jgi:glycosyltransferase involved in cell wall biosynthesis
VFLGPVEIAGYYAALAVGLRSIGLSATLVDLSGHQFAYSNEGSTNRLVKLVRRLAQRRRGARRPSAFAWTALEALARVAVLVWAIWAFDVFIFGFGRTVLGLRELPLLRLLRKRIVFVFNGTDSRPPYMDGTEVGFVGGLTSVQCLDEAKRRKGRIRWIEEHADAVVCNPLSAQFFEKPVISFLAIGIPQLPHVTGASVDSSASDVVRILHAPSNPTAKGSAVIRTSIDQLRARGVEVEYVEVSGQTHATVLQELQKCDFVVDQVYSDQPLAGFATEAAWFGKPAVVGGYGWPELVQIVPPAAFPPSEICSPDEILDHVARLVKDGEWRRELGSRAREFVKTQWASEQVARRFVEIIEGTIPAASFFDPKSLRYPYGSGLHVDRLREAVAGLVAAGKAAGLQLADKPALEEQILALTHRDDGL